MKDDRSLKLDITVNGLRDEDGKYNLLSYDINKRENTMKSRKVENLIIERDSDCWKASIDSFNKGRFEMLFSDDLESCNKEEVLTWLNDTEMIDSVEGFVSSCLHLIQQSGGELCYNGKPIRVTDISQTDGFPLSRNDILLVDGNKFRFGDL